MLLHPLGEICLCNSILLIILQRRQHLTMKNFMWNQHGLLPLGLHPVTSKKDPIIFNKTLNQCSVANTMPSVTHFFTSAVLSSGYHTKTHFCKLDVMKILVLEKIECIRHSKLLSSDTSACRKLTLTQAACMTDKFKLWFLPGSKNVKIFLSKNDHKFVSMSLNTLENPFGAFHILIKAHINPMSQRPVVSFSGSRLENLGTWVDQQIKPVMNVNLPLITSRSSYSWPSTYCQTVCIWCHCHAHQHPNWLAMNCSPSETVKSAFKKQANLGWWLATCPAKVSGHTGLT